LLSSGRNTFKIKISNNGNGFSSKAYGNDEEIFPSKKSDIKLYPIIQTKVKHTLACKTFSYVHKQIENKYNVYGKISSLMTCEN